jgi:glycosyltransferase involved in cell wall biosynthesis
MISIAIEDGLKIAVLLPCHNQAATIGTIVSGFAAALPTAQIYVFDNNSTDDTARTAARAGASVHRETRPGKGNVVRRMFADIDADIYVLADPAGAYDPADASSLVNALITEHVDMVVGTRRHAGGGYAASPGQRSFGENSFDWLYRRFFGGSVSDIASGYRAFTRRFVKSFPAIAAGFAVEIELSMHASQLMVPVAEIALDDARAAGPQQPAPPGVGPSDYLRIVGMMAWLVKENRPFLFFSFFALWFWCLGLALMVPLLNTATQGFALSNAFLGLAVLIAGFVIAGCGLVLDALGRSRIEQKRILFLTVPALGAQ